MRLADVPDYVARIGCYRDMSERFLGLEPAALADWMVADLARGGAITVALGTIRPTAVA
jgi:hypothetical protein